MAKRRPILTEQQREQRRIEQRELVVASIEQLRSSNGWRDYLRARARFRSYSARNVLLILQQRTTAHCLLGEGEIEHPVHRRESRVSVLGLLQTGGGGAGGSGQLDWLCRERDAVRGLAA